MNAVLRQPKRVRHVVWSFHQSQYQSPTCRSWLTARVKKGDVITLAIKAQEMIVIQHNVDTLDRSLVGWLEGADGGKQVTVRNEPARENIDVPVREQLIVELYSK